MAFITHLIAIFVAAMSRMREKGSPSVILLTSIAHSWRAWQTAPSDIDDDRRVGRTSGNVPANIIRSRDTGILIRVGGVSHDSATLCQSSVYAATFSFVLWQRRRERKRVFSWLCDSRDPVRDGHSIRSASRFNVKTRWDVSKFIVYQSKISSRTLRLPQPLARTRVTSLASYNILLAKLLDVRAFPSVVI